MDLVASQTVEIPSPFQAFPGTAAPAWAVSTVIPVECTVVDPDSMVAPAAFTVAAFPPMEASPALLEVRDSADTEVAAAFTIHSHMPPENEWKFDDSFFQNLFVSLMFVTTELSNFLNCLNS